MNIYSFLKDVFRPTTDTGRKMLWLLLLSGYLITILALAPSAHAAKKHRNTVPPAAATSVASKPLVIFLPFDVQVPGSYAYLSNGLTSTLASRLASRAGISAVSEGGAPEHLKQALQAGDHRAFSQLLQQSGASYLVMGSLAPKAGEFEMLCYVFSRSGSQGPTKFQENFQSVDDAMNAVDSMAWKISGSVFNAPQPEGLVENIGSKNEMAAFQTAHPERAYREGLMASTGLEAGGAFTLVNSFRSRAISGEIMDINAGDLDGDGTTEIVVLTGRALMLYHNDSGSLRMLATINLPDNLRYHTVALGDINHNGRQEIFISASNGDYPDATALEWNGHKITKLFEHAPWYLTTINTPKHAPMLVGQQVLANQLGGGKIFQLQLDAKGQLVQGKQLALPSGINVFDFTLADVNGDGHLETLIINKDNRLQIFGSDGHLLWTSPEMIGASKNFFGTLSSDNNKPDADKDSVWIHTRIVPAYLDDSGNTDILVANNRLETVTFMPNLRYFDGGTLQAYRWQNGSMHKLWENHKVAGYIANYQVVGAQQPTGQYQIYFADTESSYPFVFWSTTNSHINSYTISVQSGSSK